MLPMRNTLLALFVIGTAIWTPLLRAQSFQVYCVNNSDGTTSCSGSQDGEPLTCVNNAGGTISCSTPSGQSFMCVREPGGVATCTRPNGQAAIERPLGTGTDCTFTGQGNVICTPPAPPSRPSIAAPRLADPVVIDQPPLINPSVDFDLIQPLLP